jgi:hypothetical protein
MLPLAKGAFCSHVRASEMDMFLGARRTGFTAIFLLVSGIAFLQPSAGQRPGSLDGRWEGKLDVVDTKGSQSFARTKAALGESPISIAIHGQRASVYFGETEVMPTSFETHIYMTNAVVFATDTGYQNGHQWVETWNFALTQKDSDTLIACFSRLVNNLDIAEGENNSKFYVLAVGEFRRTSH